ncbi:hypothetical protein [Actinomyces sp. Z5]|uniref:hypothetical protein n=1 Tax=Actinomyces sp. Z5 TaxID=2250216 RepID=UPI0015EC4F77|nr:hypothetical protein [Actinomyces sp. Z5]
MNSAASAPVRPGLYPQDGATDVTCEVVVVGTSTAPPLAIVYVTVTDASSEAPPSDDCVPPTDTAGPDSL